MDDLQVVRQQIQRHLFLMLCSDNVVVLGLYWAITTSFPSLKAWQALGIAALCGLLLGFVIMKLATRYLISPLEALWQAILHVSPHEQQQIAAPNLAQLRLGRELVTNLTGQVYELTNITKHLSSAAEQESSSLSHNFIANSMPLPLIVLDNSETIGFVNQAAASYIGSTVNELVGKNVYMVLDMLFQSEATFDNWLKTAKRDTATATQSWERVRLNVRDNHPTRFFDLAAYYNKDNPQHAETLLILFDHTKRYSQDEQAINFMALSVHELRTPLALLRGYVEVFDEELSGKIDPELIDFMQKMKASLQQLTAFVNNILNVARIEDNQLQLKLQEEDWATVLTKAIEMLRLRAQVRGISVECTIAPGLPLVGVDRLSIQEVINNLVDNAIKYSGSSKLIKIDARLNKEGLVETTIQDFGVGVATSILPNLFTKFYRDHRNRAQIGGTGLGLYLSKAIVTAHGGNLTVQSKENKGSTFSFTLLPYAQLAKELKDASGQEIVREAHGWIKNHSLYRR